MISFTVPASPSPVLELLISDPPVRNTLLARISISPAPPEPVVLVMIVDLSDIESDVELSIWIDPASPASSPGSSN